MVDYKTLTWESADQLCRAGILELLGSGNYNKIFVPTVQESPEVVFRVSEDMPKDDSAEIDNTIKAIATIKENADLRAFCVEINWLCWRDCPVAQTAQSSATPRLASPRVLDTRAG